MKNLLILAMILTGHAPAFAQSYPPQYPDEICRRSPYENYDDCLARLQYPDLQSDQVSVCRNSRTESFDDCIAGFRYPSVRPDQVEYCKHSYNENFDDCIRRLGQR